MYVKEPCSGTDTVAQFFLHVIPANVNDLPEGRKQYGFDNLDFNFGQLGGLLDGKCMARRGPLPGYAITSIRTGQYVPDEGQIWKVEFPSPSWR